MNIYDLERVNEGETAYATLEFKDKDGEAVTPAVITYRIDDLITREEVLDDTVFSNPASEIEIEIPPELNKVVNRDIPQEVHVLTAIARYGIGKFLTAEHRFVVVNLEFYQVI